jgi:hypothetical protein
MRIAETHLRRIIREELVKPSDLDDQQLERLSQLLDDADLHPEFAGYDLVKGSEKDQLRLAILNDKEVVGFMTPRFDRGYWRTGAIYADPAMRGGGHMRRAIIEFFSDPSHSARSSAQDSSVVEDVTLVTGQVTWATITIWSDLLPAAIYRNKGNKMRITGWAGVC